MSIQFLAKPLVQGKPNNLTITIDSVMTPFNFPAGEAHIKGVEIEQEMDYQIADIRGYEAQDFFTLAMWADACRTRGDKTVLFLPYLPGARADRGVPFGSSVYAGFINNLGIDTVVTIDPHSPVMPGQLDGLKVVPFQNVIKRHIQDGTSDVKAQPYAGVIAPDHGAVDRATRAAHVMGVPVYKAEKTRDFETGKLTGFKMIDALPDSGKFLIVDDICDGGGTFLGLADAIGVGKDRLDLWVTHGVFSKGLSELRTKFGMIHTTDSYFTGDVTYTPAESAGTHFIDSKFLRVYPISSYMVTEMNI